METGRKYNCAGAIKPVLFTKHNISFETARLMADRANMALANNTKSNYRTVKNNISHCEDVMKCDLSFPWDAGKTLQFLAYLLFTRKVLAKTANCQLSGVRMAHLEEGLDCPCLRPPIVALLLKGTEHWDSVTVGMRNKTIKTPVTIEMMLAIKRLLFEIDFSLHTKYLFWAVCCLLWNGSLRVHEALSKSANTFDPQNTLLGGDLKIIEIEANKKIRHIIELKLKSPKEDRIGNGVILEIFANNTFLCPVKALKHYFGIFGSQGEMKEDMPIFITENKQCYSGKSFNEHLSKITAVITAHTGKKVMSHSFRAGVPSELARLGAASEEEIRGVGRWSSDAWQHYCKLGKTRRMNMVDKLCDGLS